MASRIDDLFPSQLDLWSQLAPQTSDELVAKLEEELRLAGDFQRAVLPAFPRVDYLALDMCYWPCHCVSGDVYDFVQSREGEVGIFVGDATGHGVIAAFMTMMVHLALDGLRPDLRTDEVLRKMNILLAARDTGRSVSAVYFRISPSGRLTVAHAGHPSLLVVPHDGKTPVTFTKGGCALGMFEDEPVAFVEECYQLCPGDRLVACTDGVLEWRNNNGDLFGYQRLIDSIAQCPQLDASNTLERLCALLQDFAAGSCGDDDVTLMCVQYLGTPA